MRISQQKKGCTGEFIAIHSARAQIFELAKGVPLSQPLNTCNASEKANQVYAGQSAWETPPQKVLLKPGVTESSVLEDTHLGSSAVAGRKLLQPLAH